MPSPIPEPSQNRGWIAGAVIGPLAGIIILALAVCLVRRRRGRKTMDHAEYQHRGVSDKAQLHSESILPKERFELEGQAVQRVPEFPAGEPVGAELDAENLPGWKGSHTAFEVFCPE